MDQTGGIDTTLLAPLENWLKIMARTDTVSVVKVEVLQPVQFAQLLAVREGNLGERVVRYTRNALAARDVDESDLCKVGVYVFGHCQVAKFASLKRIFHRELKSTAVGRQIPTGHELQKFSAGQARFKFHFSLKSELGIVEWEVPAEDEWPPTPSAFLATYPSRWEISDD